MILLYIDPGTGSMLFSILIGIMATLFFFAKKAFIKLKFTITGGRHSDMSNEKVPYIIFSDSKHYWNVFKPICDEFEKRKLPLKFFTASQDDPALSENYEYVDCQFIGEGNKAFTRMNLMSAYICLSTTPGLEVYQWKRSKNIDWYVHTYHAVEEGMVYRMFALDFYDAVLLTGAFQERYIRILEEKRNLKQKELYVTGSTYMDALGQKVRAATASTKKEAPVVLLAPSWGASSIFSVYGNKIIDALIKTGFEIIIRPHPQSLVSEKNIIEPLQEKYKDNGLVTWNYDNDNFEVLYKSDILITDFSGIIYDFAFAFDKPVIYADTSFDSAPYDAAWIDEELWRFKILDKIGLKLQEKDFDSLKEIICNLIHEERYQAGRQEVMEEAWQYQYQSAERTVDYMQKKYKELCVGMDGEEA